MLKHKNETVFVVVYVWRGAEFKIKAFRDQASARRQEHRWRARMNPDYDSCCCAAADLGPGAKVTSVTDRGE
jgi:hypothetical protein